LPKKKTNSNPIRKEVKISRHLQHMIDRLLASGDFTSESDVIRTAIYSLAKEYEAGGYTPKRSKIEERMERMENLLKELSSMVEALREEIEENGEEEEGEGEEEEKKSGTKIVYKSRD